MNEIKIFPVLEKDLKELAKIYNATYSNFDVGERWTEETAYKMLKYWFDRQPDLCFLAKCEGKIVGAFVVGVKPWWDGNHLVDGEIFVSPDCQKKGVGKELLRFVSEYAKKKYDVVQFDSYTVRDKYPLKWYKSIGFKEIKEWVLISIKVETLLRNLKLK